MRICPYCGASVSENAKFCPECGTKLAKPDSDAFYESDSYEKASYEQDDIYRDDTYRDDTYRDDIHKDDTYGDDTYGDDTYKDDSDEERSYDRDTDRDDSYSDHTYRRKRYDRETEDEEYAHENRRTMLIGIIMAALICVVGIGLYFVVSNMLKEKPEIEVGSGFGNKPVQVETKPESTEKPEAEGSEGIPREEAEPEEEEMYASVLETAPAEIAEYLQAGVAGSQESSVLEDGGVYHVSGHMVDGRSETSWQEGSESNGTGEWVLFQLDREYSVRYITFRMGNWRSESLFYANARPQNVLLKLDEEEFFLTFPDGMREYTVELSEECDASSVFLQVLSAYDGAQWSDCCISEMGVFGR